MQASSPATGRHPYNPVVFAAMIVGAAVLVGLVLTVAHVARKPLPIAHDGSVV